MSKSLFFKWSPNVKEQFYEQSKLTEKHKAIGNNIMETILQEGNEFINNKTKGNEFINNKTKGNEFINDKAREKQFERMNQRELVAQTNLNPFLSNNYLEDLQIQEQYLTPQNSSSIVHNLDRM
jgi:hypothetical protein